MSPPNPYASGAGGPDFERRIAAGFVCSALVGVSIFPLAFPPRKIWLQAAHLNCGIDDIVLESVDSRGSQQRVFVSVKSAISPIASDSEFTEVISKAWKDWKTGTNFDRNQDAFLLAAATSRSPRIHFFGKLTDIARASATLADFENRLSQKGYIHSTVRDLHPEIVGVIEKETQAKPDGEELRQLLRCFYVSTFDFDQEASQDKSRAIGVLKLASVSRDADAAHSCWNAIFEGVSLTTPQAKVFDTVDFQSISHRYGLKVDTSAQIRNWLANLRAHCRITRNGITASLSNLRHIKREKSLRDIWDTLVENQCILVAGPAGSGKSALAIEAAEKFAKPENVFCFQSEELAYPHLDAALQAGGLRDLNAEEWSDSLPFEPRVLLIESLERLLQSSSSREALAQLLRIVVADRRWRVIVTCRDYLADHVRDAWISPGGWNLVTVPLLDAPELNEAISDSGIPDLWLKQAAVRDALRNLKWLDLTIRAAQRIKGTAPASSWATLADWRNFVWRQLLNPEVDSRGQELLVRIGIQRATSGLAWVALDSDSLAVAEQLKVQGILRKNDIFPDRYRPEHDVLEDWALLFYVRREFADHVSHPVELFRRFGSHLMVRRAFRQFLGEHLESDQSREGVSFIRQVFTEASCAKEWREEVVIALLGSSCALEALRLTQDLWTHASGEGLRTICHLLRIAYRGRPQAETEPERPFGPGWNALMTFIHEQGDDFLRKHTHAVTALLLEWRHAVTTDCPAPQGLLAAASLVKGLWQIATEGTDRFEMYWGDEDRHYMSADANRLCWLVAAVAGALEPEFFRNAYREAFEERHDDRPVARTEMKRQSEDLVDFLISDHAGWVLARAHPQTALRLCLQAYGLRKKRAELRRAPYRQHRDCGLWSGSHDFSPPSALRGPFLELLRYHPVLGEAFILKLVNEGARRWAEGAEPEDPWEQVHEVVININGESLNQIADQGWWRCYRGWSPYPHVIECALMALEKWLLEDVGGRDVEHLQETLLRLVSRSNNVAITAVVAAIGGVHWWRCGKLAAALLESWAPLELDRHRWLNDKTLSRFGGGWPEKHSFYVKERLESNTLPHRQEQVEDFILRAQLGPGQSEVWPVLDILKKSLADVPTEQVTEEIQTARLILHRIDSRNLRAKRRDDKPDEILLQSVPPPPDLQKHLDETGKEMKANWLPMEMQMWASLVLEPMGSSQPEPQRWREMLDKARSLPTMQIEPDRLLVFGAAPTMVAAICLRDFIAELDDQELAWCITQVTGTLNQQADLTHWQPGTFLSAWQGECAAARACGFLSATRPAQVGQMIGIDEATAIALTHSEKKVRFAAAEGIGQGPSDSLVQLRACELLVLHARVCRSVDLRHRGPNCLTYEHVQTWPDRCFAIHSEILTETRQLRERFINGEAPDLRRLALFYPRGHEEEQNIPSIISVLLCHQSKTAKAVFSRVRNWLAIQFIDKGDRWHDRRKFATDSWRDRNGSALRTDMVNTGEASRLVAKRVLAMPPAEVQMFYAPFFESGRICHLRAKAGEFLKDLCVVHDTGDSTAFWTAWERFALAAANVGSHLNDSEHWRGLKVPPKAASEAFGALISAIFLNGMYFKTDQHWSPLDGQIDRFVRAFRAFHVFALDQYIVFLGTVGGSLLPSAWPEMSRCVRILVDHSGKSLLSMTSQIQLLRLLAKEASLRRVPDEDQRTWNAILYLLDVLADAGFAEAFRLRESVARTAV